MDNMQKIIECRVLKSNRVFFVFYFIFYFFFHASLPKLRDLCESVGRKSHIWWMNPRKQCFSNKEKQVHIWVWELYTLKLDKVWELRRWSEHKISPLEEAICKGQLLGDRKSVFFKDVSLSISTTLQGMSHPLNLVLCGCFISFFFYS